MSGPTTEGNGRIVKRSERPGDGLVKMLDGMKSEIAKALPRHVSPDRMARICATAIRTTPKLAQSDALSFIGAVLSLAQLGLEPNTPVGHAYLIPRNNRKNGSVETTVILGYGGMIELARRSGMVSAVYAQPVFTGDDFAWDLGTEPRITHRPLEPERVDPAKITHCYAVARIRDADPLFEVLTRQQIEARRNRSMSKNNGPWMTDTIAMMRKTAIRALWATMPKSAEMAAADAIDTAAERGAHIATVADGIAAEVLDRLGAPRDEEPEMLIEGDVVKGPSEA